MKKFFFIFFIFSLIFQNSINIFYGLKFLDLALILFFLYLIIINQIKIHYLQLTLLLLITSITLISFIINIDTGQITRILIFLYKIFFIFICIFVFSNLKEKDLIFFHKIFLFFFIITLIYLIIGKHTNLITKYLGIVGDRKGFLMISGDGVYANTAHHLLGYLLTITSVYFFLTLKNFFFRYFLLATSVYAALLTGSRTPVLLYLFFFLFLFLQQNKKTKIIFLVLL